MTTWRYIAQRATTGEILSWDVPLARDELSWALSGAGSLSGTITPDSGALRAADGRLLLEEWGTLLYAEADGEIRWGGILIDSTFENEGWSIEAAGFTTYPHGIPYGEIFSKIDVDPADVIREIWRHLQIHADGDLGVTVTSGSTPVRLGHRSYATTKDGRPLDYAIPHREWGQLYDAGWVGGTIRKQDIDATLWIWLLDHGFLRTSETTVIQPSVWGEQFHWWEVALLNIGWRGGPVYDENIDGALEQFLITHGWSYVADEDYLPHYLYSPIDNEFLSKDVVVVEAAPYELLWWENTDCGSEIEKVTKDAPLDFEERHFWVPEQPVDLSETDPDLWEWLLAHGWSGRENDNADRLYPPASNPAAVAHVVKIGYPRLGSRRFNLAFVQGDNVIDVVAVQRSGDDFANQINGLGAGEGITAVRRETANRDGRLRRVGVLVDKTVKSDESMDAKIKTELSIRQNLPEITSITVRDHPSAPIGSWSVGDDILVEAEIPWLGEVSIWCRVTGWSLVSDDTAVLSLARSDTFAYGG